MDATSMRLECLKAAVATAGDPNKVRLAETYFNYITEGVSGAEAPALELKAKPTGTGRAVVTTKGAKG